MFRHQWSWIGLLCFALLLTASGAGLLSGLSAAQKPEEKKRVVSFEHHAKLLDQVIEYKLEVEAPLCDILSQIGRIHGCQFLYNHKAFEADGLGEVNKTPINPFPGEGIASLKASMRTVLHILLDQIPARSGAVLLVRKDGFEITTGNAARKELGLSPTEPLDLVNAVFDQVELDQAMKAMSASTGVNILVDPRLGEKAKAKLDATFRNVPVETAVRLLADNASLAVVRKHNVLYVTATENAKQLNSAAKK